MNLTVYWCSNCQQPTSHRVEVDRNNEYVITCTTEGCGRFLKFHEQQFPGPATAAFAIDKVIAPTKDAVPVPAVHTEEDVKAVKSLMEKLAHFFR